MTYFSRYRGDGSPTGKYFNTARAIINIRTAVSAGALSYDTVIVRESERLDHIAHRYYGDGRMWWVIAAASGIGWWPQVPPGTRIRVPIDIDQIEAVF